MRTVLSEFTVWVRSRQRSSKSGFGEINMFKVKEFEKDDIDSVIAFERELRKQEPDTYY